MGLDKPYLDIPGTTIFDADQARKGYPLNRFAMSKGGCFAKRAAARGGPIHTM